MGQIVQSKRRYLSIKWLYSENSQGNPSFAVSSSKPESGETQGEKQKEEQQKRRLTAKETLGIFGFGILLSWLFLCYFSGQFFPGENISSGFYGSNQWLGLGVFSLATALYLIRSDIFTKIDMRKFSIIPLTTGLALPVVAMIACHWVPVPDYLKALAWGLNGIASACVMLMWANYFCRIPREIIIPSIIMTTFVAGFWYLLVMLFPINIKGVGIYVSLLLSIACISIFLSESTTLSFISRKESERNIGLDIRTSISLGIAGCAQGYLLHRIIFGQIGEAIYIVGGAFILCAVLMWVFNRIKGKYSLLLAPYFRYALIPSVACFALFPFLDGIALIICEIVLLAILMQHLFSLFVNLSYAIKKYEVQSFYLWVRTHFPTIFGLALGWGTGYTMMALLGVDAYQTFLVVLVFSLVFIVLFTVSVTVTPYGCDHLTVPEDYEHDEENNEYKSVRKAWGKACDIVAQRYRLTPRETEVFLLLAKGRNSKVIERELNISNHTVKSHNYNIYRKMGVESQQELIDTIEVIHSKIRLTI